MAYGSSWARVKSELQLPATAMAMPDVSHICDLVRSLWQCWILNPLKEARSNLHPHGYLSGSSPLGHNGNLRFFVCLFLLFRATPVAYGGSQARGRIGATAAGLHHSHSYSQIWATSVTYITAQGNARILNPLSEARDRTCNLMNPGRIHFRRAMMGTPGIDFKISIWKVTIPPQ